MKILIFVLMFFPFCVSAISSESAVVMDASSNRVLFCKNCHESSLIASTTKIMSALVALEYGDLSSEIKVGPEVLKAYGSAVYLSIDEVISLESLLYGLLLRSGNDAAIEIAYLVSGSMDSFVYLMNDLADRIGMDDTNFINNHGLEESGVGNMSTALDMGKLMSYASKNNKFMEISGTKEITIKSSMKTYAWKNKNKLLSTYSYCTGGKTGYTEMAHRTLVTSASLDDKDLVVVTFNDGNDFSTHKSLYEEYFNDYELVKVIDKDNYVVDDLFVVKNDFSLLVNSSEKSLINTSVNINKSKYVDGDVVGEVLVKIADEVVGRELLFYESSTDVELSFFQKLWKFIKFW